MMPNCCAATSKEASTKKKETYRRIASVKRNDALPIVEYIRTNTNPHFVQDIDAILVSNSNSSQHIFGIDLLVFKDNRAPRRCLGPSLSSEFQMDRRCRRSCIVLASRGEIRTGKHLEYTRLLSIGNPEFFAVNGIPDLVGQRRGGCFHGKNVIATTRFRWTKGTSCVGD